MRFRPRKAVFTETWAVPAESGVPADLPPWARDELVRLRLANADLRNELMQLRLAACATNEERLEVLRREMDDAS